MQWLHFVNELDCYKSKENKKQLLNINKSYVYYIATLKDQKNHYRHFDFVVYWVGGGGGLLDPNPHFLKTGGPVKKQSYMPENYLQNKEFTWVSRFFFYLDLHIKFLKRKCLGSSGPPVNKGII